MGHLNSFSASGGGNLNKNFQKIQMPGGGCLSFDLTGTLHEHDTHCPRTLHAPYAEIHKNLCNYVQ